ncbi:MAG: hypothetical protein C4534_07880 [Gaiellales bacterium]|nr:MAG: hypothetical protein C4534_07880 [Gaiellales bacterium]
MKAALEARDYDAVAAIVLDDPKALNRLISFAMNKDELVCWHAIEAMGVAAGLLSRINLEAVRNTVRRILWSAREESGGMGWSAPELLGEIVSANPRGFDDMPPIIVSLHTEDEEGVFLRGVLWAVRRMAEGGVTGVEGADEVVRLGLRRDEADIRGLAAMAAAALRTPGAAELVEGLAEDERSFRYYQDGEYVEARVGDVARQALEMI